MTVQAKPETVVMVLNRDHVLRTTKHHSVEFFKDQPVNVPLAVYADAVGIGATRSDGKPADVLGDDKQKMPLTPEQSAALLDEAIDGLVKKNDREDFTATGVPTVAAVNRETGEKYDSKTIADAFKAYQAKGA